MFVTNVNGTYTLTDNVNDVLKMMRNGTAASIRSTESIRNMPSKVIHIGNGSFLPVQEN